ncbi:MAG: aminotransferase class V-fold PLP-dependent enzyme, partial [Thermoguttaceae bacterium]
MWSRKRIDIAWSDLAFGLFQVCFPPMPARITDLLASFWPNPEQILVCLSVRSGFDLLLGALQMPRGSEVLVSAITIPDMLQIMQHHGLVPIPVDLDPQQMAPTMDDWQRAITPTTKAVLIAHLFGARVDTEAIIKLAHQHGLLVIEDCAQAFAGCGYQGHSEVDASMFSFGVIKSNTALGGAVLRIRDSQLLARMRAQQATYPIQNRRLYGKTLVKYAGLKTLA